MARRRRSELSQRRHGDQADRRPHRHGRRLPHGDRRRPRRGRAGRADRRRCALHLVPARGLAPVGAQEVDRGLAQDRAARSRSTTARCARSRPARACCRRASPAVDGEFGRGDVVDVKDRLGRVLARGLVAYAAEDARRIAGRKSAEIERLLGFRGRDEMVHRDDLVRRIGLYWRRPMNALTKPAEDAAAIVAELGRRARDAAVALRNASTEAKNRALADAAAPDPRRAGRDPGRQRQGHRGRQGRRHDRRHAGPPAAERGARRRHGQGSRRHRRPARSGRRGDRADGPGPTASSSAACACRSASSA